MNDQLTVLVKKADGTTTRVPVSSLLPSTIPAPASASPAVPAPVAPVVTKPKPAIPKPTQSIDTAFREEIKRLVPPIPAPAPLPKAEAMVKKADPDFHTSLLEEARPTGAADLPMISSARPGEAEAVIRKLSFTVPANLQNRLRSLIQLNLKEVRTVAQTLAVAVRPITDGGLGLTEAQAKELVAGSEMAPPDHPSFPSLKGGEDATPAPQKNTESAPPFKLSPISAVRKPMHDIMERAAEVGPIDEIRLLTATDLRRLSSNPSEAVTRLKQKFTNLREESILFYLEALQAWQESPLYRDYIKTLATALSLGAPLGSAPNAPGALKTEEVTALAGLNQSLLV